MPPDLGLRKKQYDEYIREEAGKYAASQDSPYFGEPKGAIRRREGARAAKFRSDDLAERRAKMGETTGLGDLLTFLPAGYAAKAALSKAPVEAAVNALAFTSQFDDSQLGADVQDALAFFPVFGLGSTKGLAAAQKRMAERGANLPFLSGEGKMSPRRLREFTGRMENWIKNGSSKDPSKILSDLADWKSALKGGTKPVDKSVILDRMPASLRQSFYQSAKEMGYQGIDMPTRSKAPMDKFGNRVTKEQHLAKYEGDAVTGGRMNPTQEAPSGRRTWEEILGHEQSGGVPKAWEEVFKKRQSREVAKKYLEQLGVGSVLGTGANLLSPDGTAEGDQKAGLVVNKRNIGRLRQLQEQNLERLNKIRPKFEHLNELEATFAAKYPKIYEKTAKDGSYTPQNSRGGGAFDPKTGEVFINAPEDSKIWQQNHKLIPHTLDTFGHEAIHALDYQRLGKVNALGSGRKLTLDDFGKNYRDLRTIRNDLGGQHELAAQSVFRNQPIEKRAYKAGSTAQKSTSDLLLGLADPSTLKEAPKARRKQNTTNLKRFLDLEEAPTAKEYDAFKRFQELTKGENPFGGNDR